MYKLMTALVAQVPLEETRVAVGDASLAVYTAGPRDASAPPLVFLHAAVCDARSWARQFETFGATRRVVAYDRRGFGATASVDESFSSVDDLWAVMDALAIDRAILVGNSQGGRIALDATLARPERVVGLVLVGAAISGAPETPNHDPRVDTLIAAYGAAKQSGDIAEQNRIEAHVWLDGPDAQEGRVGGDARALFLAMNQIALDGPESCAADLPEPAYARLGSVAIPTLVMWGPLDVPSVIVNMKHAAATIPGAVPCELAGIAHLPSLEAPERFDAALAAFLDDAFA